VEAHLYLFFPLFFGVGRGGWRHGATGGGRIGKGGKTPAYDAEKEVPPQTPKPKKTGYKEQTELAGMEEAIRRPSSRVSDREGDVERSRRRDTWRLRRHVGSAGCAAGGRSVIARWQDSSRGAAPERLHSKAVIISGPQKENGSSPCSTP